MKHGWSLSLVTVAARLLAAHPLIVDQATFTLNGGNVNDVANSIRTKNDRLRSYSYNTAWLAVGNLASSVGSCTATWLGDKDNWSYLLTAAHCVPYNGEVTEVSGLVFTAWDQFVVASGTGTAYVPPERVNKPPHMGGASTDIAVVRLPRRRQMVGHTGRPLERPILNDASDENGRDVIFVGYGSWGVGEEVSGSFWPASGQRRLYARGRIDDIFELDYGIGATYNPTGPSESWGRVASGDSGSAWWQIRNNRPVIIATTNGGHATKSTAARVSKYIQWIRSRYPDALVSSAEKPRGCIWSLQTNDTYCMTVGETSLYSLPAWINSHQVYVDAAPGTAVVLCDWDNLSYSRIASFVGTVENDELKAVKAANGETLDFSRPRSMRVESSTTPVGCITDVTSVNKYCLPPGKESGYALPPRIYRCEVQVEGLPSAPVVLSDWDNLSYNRLATFRKFVQNWEMKSVTAANGDVLDFSRPRSMRVL